MNKNPFLTAVLLIGVLLSGALLIGVLLSVAFFGTLLFGGNTEVEVLEKQNPSSLQRELDETRMASRLTERVILELMFEVSPLPNEEDVVGYRHRLIRRVMDRLEVLHHDEDFFSDYSRGADFSQLRSDGFMAIIREQEKFMRVLFETFSKELSSMERPLARDVVLRDLLLREILGNGVQAAYATWTDD
jgi:hypothetical protein